MNLETGCSGCKNKKNKNQISRIESHICSVKKLSMFTRFFKKKHFFIRILSCLLLHPFYFISFPVDYRCFLLLCVLYFPKQFNHCCRIRASVRHLIFFVVRCCFLELDSTRACSVVDIRRQNKLSIENGPLIFVIPYFEKVEEPQK